MTACVLPLTFILTGCAIPTKDNAPPLREMPLVKRSAQSRLQEHALIHDVEPVRQSWLLRAAPALSGHLKTDLP